MNDELAAIRGQLIDVNTKQAQLWASGLHEKFNALFDSVDGADYAPPQQARDVFAEFCAQLDELTARFERVLKEGVPALDGAARAAGILAVGLPM